MVVSASDLKRLAKTRGSSLRSLEIRGCKMFSDDGLIDIARPDGKWLHELALRNTVMESLSFHDPFDRYDMKDVTRLAKKCSNSLVSLNIFPRFLSDFRKVFNHAKKLDHFGIGIINEDWDYSGVKFPSNIRALHIEDLREASFPFLLPYLNQLRELDIECVDLQPNCLCFLIKSCPNLEVLVTQDICGDEGLQVIGQFCKKLRKLNHRWWLTQMGLVALAQECPNLDYLQVYLLDITNEALECVGTHLKNLRDFRIFLPEEFGITHLPLDKGVRDMLMGCRKLERLDIDFCLGGLTDVGLGYIGKYGHNLRYLTLSCTGESDVGLLELSKGCPKLRTPKLKGCPFSKLAIATSWFLLRWENLVKKKSQKLNVQRLDDFTEDNLQEIACPSRSDDHTQEVNNAKVCCNEEEVQADIFAVEGSGVLNYTYRWENLIKKKSQKAERSKASCTSITSSRDPVAAIPSQRLGIGDVAC
nr:hypothetical protein [Tanacetum cinerariifolium]